MPDRRQTDLDELISIASADSVLGYDASTDADVRIPFSLLDARFASSGTVSSDGAIDGGSPESTYGGTETIDGGTP